MDHQEQSNRVNPVQPGPRQYDVAIRLHEAQEEIMSEWERRARKCVPGSQEINSLALRDSLPKFIDELVNLLNSDRPIFRPSGKERSLAKIHGNERAHTRSYDILQLIDEYELLRKVIIEILSRDADLPRAAEDTILSAIGLGIRNAAAEFVKIREQDFTKTNGYLKESEERFRNLLEKVPHIVWRIDPQGQALFFSRQFRQYTGLESEEGGLGMGYAVVVHPDDYDTTYGTLKKAQGLPFTSYQRIKRADGVYRWHFARGNPVFDSQNNFQGWIGTTTDVHERKLAEEALKKTEERLLQATAATGIGVWEVDTKTRNLWRTESHDRIFGLAEFDPELNVDAFFARILDEDQNRVRLRFEESIQNKKPFREEFRFLHSDGSIRWMVVQGEPVLDEHGNIERFMGTNQDVTESVLSRKNIEEREWRFRQLADAMPQIVWTSEPDGNLDYYNKGFYEYTGYNFDDMKGWGWDKIMHPDDFDRTVQTWTESLRTGKDYYMEYRLRRADGEFRWHLGRAVAIRNEEGKIIKWYGTNTDIHDFKVLNEQLKIARIQAEAANASKTSFLANMSHEIRTPMTAVLGFTDLLRDPTISDQERQDAISRIDRSGRSLLRVLDDVLDISKIEAGKLAIQKSRFSPVAIGSDVVALLRLSAEQKGVHVRLKVDPSAPSMAYSDPARVRQILMNLVGNAVKFTLQGEIVLSIKAQFPNCLIFEVCDTGIGIAQVDQSKLFHPFAQADDSISRKFGGTGLGLLLSRRLAEQLGGDLNLIKSHPGEGSLFRARIDGHPFEFLMESPTAVAFEKQENVKKDKVLEGVRILLAEDVTDNQILMKKYLAGAGAQVEIANDGQEAIQKAEHQNYDIVLMDIQMPKMDGIQAVQQLRSRGFQFPILALTAHALTDEVNRSLEAGCDAHLTKPIARETLVSTVHNYAAARPQI